MRSPTQDSPTSITQRPEPPHRLWWLHKAIGYSERAPGALYPHLILADGSLFGEGLRWRAGDECAYLTGWHADCELEGFSEHMVRVNAARHSHPDFPAPEFAVEPPAPLWRRPIQIRREQRGLGQLRRTCYCPSCQASAH